jgi:hypothetical protein
MNSGVGSLRDGAEGGFDAEVRLVSELDRHERAPIALQEALEADRLAGPNPGAGDHGPVADEWADVP